MSHPTPLYTLIFLTIAFSAQAGGVHTVIAGDSYSAGTVGIRLEKQFKAKGEKVARYGISSSFIKHWIEKNEHDKTMGEGVGVDWASPGKMGEGNAPEDYPKLRSILKGEASSAKRVVIILGTNGLCEDRTINDAGTLAKQIKETLPEAKCIWVGPKFFSGLCGGSRKRQNTFSQSLGEAIGGSCEFINSTRMNIRPANLPHVGDYATEWANAVAEKFP